jgi:hypothetical protein
MRQNLTLLGFLFLFLAYLVVTDRRDELQYRWDSQVVDHSNLTEFMNDDDFNVDHVDYPDTLSI